MCVQARDLSGGQVPVHEGSVTTNALLNHRIDPSLHFQNGGVLAGLARTRKEDRPVGFGRRREGLRRLFLRPLLHEFYHARSTSVTEKVSQIKIAVCETTLALLRKQLARAIDHLARHQSREVRVFAQAHDPW